MLSGGLHVGASAATSSDGAMAPPVAETKTKARTRKGRAKRSPSLGVHMFGSRIYCEVIRRVVDAGAVRRATGVRVHESLTPGSARMLWHPNTREAADLLADPATCSASQIVNGFPGMRGVSCKRELARLLNRLRELHPDAMAFYPRTYVLPEDLPALRAATRKGKGKGASKGAGKAKGTDDSSKCSIFIFKPDEASQGDGIYLMEDTHDIDSGRKADVPAVVQEYLERPLLLDGYKFDCESPRWLNALLLFWSWLCMSRFVCSRVWLRPAD